MSMLVLDKVKKSYGSIVACDIDYLEVKDGEFLTLLGPSGCGKTTTLRIISGVIQTPDCGRILIDGLDVTGIPMEKRDTTMVFQNYALFPHMSVYQNIAFGLKMKRFPMKEIEKRVADALEFVHLKGVEDRKPSELSGGQQQRVAIARAIVCKPKVLLFDEPLSNLDAKLREAVRVELDKMRRSLGITSIYVTHDQTEALFLSDRIAVMNNGRVLQLGTPEEIYFSPSNQFVGDFIGQSNFIEGVYLGGTDNELVEIKLSDDMILKVARPHGHIQKGDRTFVLIRPEYIQVSDEHSSHKINTLRGIVTSVVFAGDHLDVRITVGNQELKVYLPPKRRVEVGKEIWLDVEGAECRVMPVGSAGTNINTSLTNKILYNNRLSENSLFKN